MSRDKGLGGRGGVRGMGGRATAVDHFKAWLVTGSPGRGVSFAIDFAVAVRRGLLRRHQR